MQLVVLSGSPSARSRSAWLMQLTQTRLEAAVRRASTIELREKPPQALLAADVQQPVQLRPPAREPTPLDRAVGKQPRHVGLGAVLIVAIIFGAVFWALALRFFLSL